ncbi:copper amine oxidase N-terminal domain-containing protein [Paenibacillus kobensis]|uniref:copper amine oxidase N-terminal domain-containing protein n=1 Tax=Paenibacillus kobensis TaxID=59841 RepID=UPI0013E32B46|nr:copper amine oxidase N-terminal domain-containing protein [Paenibacillus kobensis]
MNKKVMMMTAVLGFSMMVSTAFAAPGGKGGGNDSHSGKSGEHATVTSSGKGNGNSHEGEDKNKDKGTSVTDAVYGNNGKGKGVTVTGSVYGNNGKGKGVSVTDSVYGHGKGVSVTDSVYGHGHRGAHGLLNAYGNVKDKPAGARIASLLKSKYGIDVTIEANTDLSALAKQLEAEGKKEAAAYVQGMADVLVNPSDLEAYKKLGKLNKKLGKKDIGAFVNGEELQFDVAPVVEAGHTLVPFRAIAEALDAEVLWDPATQTVTVTRDGVEVKIVLGSKSATVNGSKVTIEYPGKMKDSRVMVPLRFLGEAFKAEVQWEPESRCVIILDSSTTAAESTNE